MAVEQVISVKIVADNKQGLAAAKEVNAEVDKISKPRALKYAPASHSSKAVQSANNAAGVGETTTARSIGIGAGTGSAASDFAAQARGLGGLVHVYATFAANIFAVSAAFNALSKAMDVTNLVKGLDQLGAQSGRALGSLAKQLVTVTDGALSLQDAMRSTALASSGGMTNSAIVRMTEVARKASLALGRDMPDSMDRLTKGIVKIQPELLDELGIMTRVIPAQQAYAKSVGKSVESLTDFEKRQAFANAVLAEGEKKFGAINLLSNPYSKISASLQNLLQSGLEALNSVLGPIVGLLASSPTALAAAIGMLGAALLKQALPALGSFRASMKQAAAEATGMAVVKAKEAEKGYRAAVLKAKAQADDIAQTEAETVIASEEKIKKLKLDNSKSTSKLLKSVMDTELSAITKEQIAALNKQAEISSKTSATYDAKGDTKKAESYARTSKALKEYATNLEIYAAAEEAHKTKSEEAARTTLANDKSITTAKQNRIIADRALQSSMGKQIAAQSAETGSIHGFGTAWKEARLEIAKMREGTAIIEVMNKETGALEKVGVPAIGGFKSGWLSLKAGISAATGALGTFMNFLGPWIAAISIAIGLIQGLYTWASKSRDANDRFNASIDSMSAAAKTANDTLDAISNKGMSESMSVESLQARANAFAGLNDSITESLRSFRKLETLKNPFESIVDSFYGLVGKADSDILYKGIAKSVQKSLDLITDPKLKQSFQTEINNIFGKEVNPVNLEKVLSSMSELDRMTAMDKLAEASKRANVSINNTASTLTTLIDDLKNLDSVSTAFMTSLLPTDDFFKMGSSLYKIIADINKSLGDSQTTIEAIVGALSKSSGAHLIAPEAIKEMDALKARMDEISQSRLKLNNQLSELGTGSKGKTHELAVDNINDQIRLTNTQMNSAMQEFNQKGRSILEQWRDAALKDAQEYFKRSEKIATEANNRAIEQARLSVISSHGGQVARAEMGVASSEAKSQREDIELKFKLSQTQIDNTQAIIENTQELALLNARNSGDAGKIKDAQDNIDKTKEAKKLDTKTLALEQAKQMALDKVSADLKVKMIGLQDKANKETLTFKQKELDSTTAALTNIKSLVALRQQYSLSFDKELSDAEAIVDTQLISLKYQKERNNIEADMKAIGKNNPVYAQLEAQLSANTATEAQEKLIVAANAAYKEANGILANKLKLMDRDTERTKLNNDAQDSAANTQRGYIAYYKEIGAIKEEEAVKSLAVLDIEKSIRDEKEAQIQIEREKFALLGELDAKKRAATIVAPGKELSVDKAKEFEDEAARITANAALKSATLASTAAGTQKLIGLNSVLAASTAENNRLMQQMQNTTSSLSAAFGEMGAAIGGVGEAILSMAQNEATWAANRVELEAQVKAAIEERKAADTPRKIDNASDKEAKASEKLANLDDKHTQDSISNLGKLAGASKKMFAEKSAGYKVLEGVQKAAAVVELALTFKTMATKLSAYAAEISGAVAAETAKTGAATAGFASRIGIYIKEIYASWGAAGPWMVGAASLFIASMLGGSGGADFTLPAGLNAETMQATQGTGQSYNAQGNLVDNGGGTFGDTSAKSASIQNSLDLIAETSVEGMSYYNEMVGLLTAIKDSIGKLAISLYDTKGIRTGTNFGTVEATSGGGGGLLSGLFGSSSTDTSIINSGIQLQGTFMDLARAATTSAASLNQFETVQTTTTKSGALFGLFGGGSSTSITNNIKELDSTVREQIGGIFTNASQLFVAQGKKLGASQESVIAMLEGVDVNKLASLRGLKGKELEEELNAVIGGIMDDAAKKLFPKLDQFKKFNEGYAQTVTRVLDTSDKVNQAFLQLGRPLKVLEEVASKSTEQMVLNIAAAKAKLDRANQAVSSFKPTTSEAPIGYGTVTSEIDPSLIREQAEAERELAEARRIEAEAASGMTVKNLELTESFANAAGGLDKFLDLTTSFAEKYLTLSEQLAPKMTAMNTEMARLGIPLNTTKEQLKQLILGFDTTNASQAQYYVDLLKLADAYDTNRSALNDLADSYGIGEDAIKGILQGAAEAASGSGEVGYSITGAILDSIKTAMYEQASSAISTVIFDTVVTPMVKSMLAGTLAADLMSGAFDSAIASAAAMIDNISNVFNNPELMGVLDGLSEKITGLFEKGAAALGGIKVPGTSGPSKGGTYGSGSSSQTTLLESNELELKKVQAQLLIAENKSIEGNILLKEVQAAIEAEELKKIDNVNKAMYLANKQREKEMNILKERIGLQNELNGLTDNALEALARQREALDETNRAIFDQIQALKGQRALLQSQVSATELFTPVETLTLKIKELAEQAKAAGAGSSVDDLIASFSSMGIDDVKELAQSILAMTDISDAMKASFLGILNTLAGLKKAEEERIKSLQNALESTRQSIAQAYQSFVDAEKTARENITSGYLSAQERVKSAQEAINEALRQNAEELKEFANNIREFLLELATTDLGGRSKASQYKSLQEDYTKTYALALTGDTAALSSITNKASELLNAGKEQSSTSLEYALLAGEIGANLEALATITDGKAGPLAEAVDPMVKLQKELVEATEDMERWTHAASVSGASTTAIVKDYLAEWRVAKAELTLAQQLIEENGINISLLSSIESFKKLIAEYAAAAARLTASNSGAVTAVIPTEIPGVKDSLTAAEVKAQMTNFGNWYDWSTSEGNKGGITAVHQFAERWKMSSATLEGIMGWAAGYANQQYASVGLTALATGTNYVPQDMIAQIHEGEAVVPKAFNPYAGGSTSTNNQQDLIREFRLLRQEVSDLKQSNNMSVAYNKKTSDILTRVTLGGEAMQTQAA